MRPLSCHVAQYKIPGVSTFNSYTWISLHSETLTGQSLSYPFESFVLWSIAIQMKPQASPQTRVLVDLHRSSHSSRCFPFLWLFTAIALLPSNSFLMLEESGLASALDVTLKTPSPVLDSFAFPHYLDDCTNVDPSLYFSVYRWRRKIKSRFHGEWFSMWLSHCSYIFADSFDSDISNDIRARWRFTLPV